MSIIQILSNLFKKPAAAPVIPPAVTSPAATPVMPPRRLLTVDDILTSSGKYPERATSSECTAEVRGNAYTLVSKVNSLFLDLGVPDSLSVSSGFRTQAANAGIPNAAKKSSHMEGKAVDLLDADGKLDAAIFAKPELLVKHNLYLEHPESTTGWTHLDIRPRDNHIFKV